MNSKKLNIFIFILVFLEVFYFKNYLFRSYDTPGQESLISYFAHQVAMSNWVRTDYNIFVTKILNCEGNLVYLNDISNWPNGFFYLFSIILKFFGNYEIVGRIFALFLNLFGMFLFIKYIAKKKLNNYLYFSIPIIIASPIGLSSLNVVYPDSILILLISILNIFNNYFVLYLLVLLLTPLFYHIILVYNFIHAVYLKVNQLIDYKKFFLVCVTLTFSFFHLIYVLTVNENGFEFNKLYEKFLVRSFIPNLTEFNSQQHEIGENVNFFHRTYLFYALIKDNLSIIAFPFLLIGLFNEMKKKTLLFFIFASTILVNYLFLQYFIVHYYSNLLFVFLSTILMILGLSNVLKNINLNKYIPILLTFFLLFNINILDKNLIYGTWKPVIEDSNKFKNFLSSKANIGVNGFEVKNYKSDDRICGFYLLPTIIKNYKLKKKTQNIDLNLY